jgi:hypothetical protein
MPGPADLHALAEELLVACEGALASVPAALPGLDGAPERSFVTFGEPALDCCPQLTVTVDALSEMATQPAGLAAGTRHRSARLSQALLIVTLVRCVPIPDENGDPPPVAELAASAQQLHADGWALWNRIYNLLAAGALLSACSHVDWDGMRRLGPQGGCAGWRLTLRIRLDGYVEALP